MVLDSRRLATPFQRLHVLARDEYVCQECHIEFPASDLHVDHKIPHSQGGPTELWNLQTLCRWCNEKKGEGLMIASPAGIIQEMDFHLLFVVDHVGRWDDLTTWEVKLTTFAGALVTLSLHYEVFDGVPAPFKHGEYYEFGGGILRRLSALEQQQVASGRMHRS